MGFRLLCRLTLSPEAALSRSGSSAANATLRELLSKDLEGIRQAGTWKTERVITSRQAAAINVQEKKGDILNFCANNYLGLSAHPEVIEAAKAALDKYGNGLSSTRFICGTQDIHKELEDKIARFHGKEDAILYASCFDANAGLFEVMLKEKDAVFSDQLNHASIIDGLRLARTRKFRYKHRDTQELKSQLEEARDAPVKLIVSDGIFSMDGSIVPLKEISELAEQENALIFLDECHATGFLGDTGRGTEEFLNMTDTVDIINSTLGKALGGAAGGYTAGPKPLIDLLRQRSRPYLFSNSVPPPVVASASKVFDLVTGEGGRALMSRLHSNTDWFRQRITSAGFTVRGDRHPIVPIMLGDSRLAVEFAHEMLQKGIYVIGFTFPVVPNGEARIRVQISAVHSPEEVEQCAEAFIEIGKAKGVI